MTDRQASTPADDEPERNWLSELVKEAVIDPMVPKGYVEMRDGDGKLLRRQWIGGDDG